MTYNPFADLDPLNEEYGSKNSFNSSSDTNLSTDNFDSNNPFADLDPLNGQPQPKALAPVEVVKPENDSPNSAVTDFILRDEDSFAGKVNRGAAERASTLAGGLVRFVGQTADEMADWMEERVPLGVVDISTDGISWRPSTEEDIAKPSFLLPAARTLENADFGYKAGTTWEEVKAEPLSNVLPWALEQGLISVPDMAASVVALPLYITARTGEIGQARAENKDKKDATFQDFIEVLPVAVAASLLERMGTGKIFGVSTPVQSIADVPKEVLKRGLTEGGLEAVQEPLEYAAETIGTNVEFDPAVALESSLQGLISGTVTGSTISAATIPSEIALAKRNPSDGGPSSDGSGNESGTLSPEFQDPNAIAITGDGTVVYKEGAKPDAPTSEASDIAQVEVDINAQRAELDDDLAKIMAELDKPLGVSVPPSFTPTPQEIPEAVEDASTNTFDPNDPFADLMKNVPTLDPDALAITADDMAQMDLDDVENQLEIDQEIAAFNASIATTPTELPPVAPVKKKLLPLSQRPENTAQTKKVNPKMVDPTKDDFLTAIAKSGGIARDSAEGVDPVNFNMRRGGLNPVFKLKGGTSLDDMNTIMSQYGYIPPNSDANEFSDLLQQALRGKDVVSTANTELDKRREAEREEDFVAQGGIVPEAPAPQASVSSVDQTLTSALEEARNGGLPQSEIDSILTNYPKESDAVLQLQMSMAGVELGDSSGSNQATRMGELPTERDNQSGSRTAPVAGQRPDEFVGQGNNGSQNVTDEMGILLSPSVASGNTIANSEAGSGGGINNAGLSGAVDADSSSLRPKSLRNKVSIDRTGEKERTRVIKKFSNETGKWRKNLLRQAGLMQTGDANRQGNRIVDAMEGGQLMATYDTLEAFTEAVRAGQISQEDVYRYANAVKTGGSINGLIQYSSNARTIYSWATANNDLEIPLRSPASQKIYDDKVAQAEIDVEADRVADKEKTASVNKFFRENRSDLYSFWENASIEQRTELINQVSVSSVMGQYTDKQIKLNVNKNKVRDLPSNTIQFLVKWMPDNWANFRDSNNSVNTTEAQTEESFDLEAQTEESLAADTEQAATAATEQAAKEKTASSRAKADADLGGFKLTGSNAPADVAVANGQDDMFDADSNATGQKSTDGDMSQGDVLFSKSVVLPPSANPKGVSKQQAKERIKLFLERYKGADDVNVIIRDTQAATFGVDSRKLNGGIAAGFLPETNTVVLVLENLDSVQEIDAAIRHELLVHKGLGLFKKEDVNKLLNKIQENASKSKTLEKMWEEVQSKYKKETLEVQAEELLAKVAEKKMSKPDKYWNKIVTFIRDMLRKIGLVKEISFADLRKVVYNMGDAFKDGRRADRREGFADKTNETKSPSSDGLSGSKGFSMKKGGRVDKNVKVKAGDGTADVTIYGVDSNGKHILIAKARKGGWDIVVDRRVDGEMFTDGKPIQYTVKNRKQVADRIESLGLTLEEKINQYPPAQGEVLNEADSFFMASSTVLERRRFDFQDRFLSALKVQKAIEDFTFEQISEDLDFYNRETLKHGVTTAQITEFNDVFIDPMFDLMKKNGLSITDVGNFLYARHAPEANAEMKRRNAAFEDNESKSGMSDVDAAKIMADFKAAGKMDVLNGIAKASDKVIERTRQILVETGLLSESTVQGYRDMYDVYVPLLGDPMDPDGKIKKSKDESRFGRKSRANNVLINLIVQHEQTIIRGEANVLKRVMLKLVEQNPNPDFWVIDKTTEEKVLDPVTDLFKLKETPTKGNSKHVVSVRVAGEEHLIVFEQSNDHAMMLAKSMNNINAQEVNMFVQAGLKFNRYVSMINTQYNLEFMPTNLARDIQTALINVYQYDDVDNAMVGRIAKNVKKSIKAIREYQKGNRDGEMAGWYDEFYKNGAQTGWLDNYETMASRAGQLERMMMRKGYMPMDAAYRMVELVADMNTAYENGVRLSTYIELRKSGYSIQKASIASKNLTVNFNRRGDKALLAGSLYVFFNASMQGNAAIIQAAQSKAVRKAMLAVFGMQVALEMMNRLMGDDDEDGQSVYSKIPLYIRNNNWVFLLPDFGDNTDAAKRLYIKIPLSYGYNVINVTAQVTGAAAAQLLGNRDADGLDAGVGLSRIWGALVHGFNPIGSDASTLQAVSPTFFDPLAQDSTNENFAGQPIRPADNPYGPPKPNSMLFWQSTPEYIKSISSTLNEVSGGTDIRPGDVSISPETIEHYTSFFMGGAGRFAKDITFTPAKVVTGQETQLRDYPWIRKFLGQVGDRTDVDNYYKAHTDIAYAQQAVDAAAKTEGSAAQIKAAVKLVEKEEGYKLRLIPRLEAVDLSIASKKLQKASYENDTKMGDKVKKTLIDGIDKEIRRLRITFVSMYRRNLDRQARSGG